MDRPSWKDYQGIEAAVEYIEAMEVYSDYLEDEIEELNDYIDDGERLIDTASKPVYYDLKALNLTIKETE